jgi:hypothetical protein
MAEYRDSCYEVPVSRSMALQAIAWCRQQLQPGAAAQPEPPTFQESQARKSHYEAELAGLKCEAMHQPAPAVKDSLTAAPAGSLVERVVDALDGGTQVQARAAIRVIVEWLHDQCFFKAADWLEHEASQ